MKKIYLSLGIVATIGLGLFQTSCKKSPLDNLMVSVNTDVLVAPTAIIFENAKADADLQPLDFDVTISGQDAEKVLSAIGNKSFKAQNGFLILNFSKDSKPTESDPLIFQISGTAPGFEKFTKDVIITSNKEQHINIKMIEAGNLPEGLIEHKTTISTLNAGTFSQDEVIATSSDANTEQATKLTIAAGTTMTDTEGNAITANNLAVNVRYFDPRTEAIEVFPGGLNPQDVLDKDGKKIEGGVQFYSAGLMQIKMTAGDKVVKNFSKPVSAEMELHANQDNPKTGEPLKAGDTYPLWSRNDETGQWKEEGEATIVEKNGKLVAVFEMNHLSSWNLDDFTRGTQFTNNKLDMVFESNTTIDSDYYEDRVGRKLKITMYSKGGTRLGSTTEYFVYNGLILDMPQVPDVEAAYFEIYSVLTGKVLTTETFNPKTKGRINIDLNYFYDNELVTINFKYNIKCTSNKNLKPNSGAFLILTDVEKNLKFSYRLNPITAKNSDGNLKFKLRNNRRYRLETIGLDGKVISYEQLFDVNNLTYKIINGFTVDKLKYDSTKKLIDVEVTYTTSKC